MTLEMSGNETIESWAREIQTETCLFWRHLEKEGHPFPAGVAVFYGPVHERPDLMIVGINPGGGPESFDAARCEEIPRVHDYVAYEHDSSYPIAGRMCTLFREIRRFDLLERSVKLNLNFFRSRGETEWKALPAVLRQRVREFCDERVDRIIARLLPRVILAEGLSTYENLRQLPSLRHFNASADGEHNSLYRRSEAPDRLLIGIRHPTGPGRPGDDAWSTIGSRLAMDFPRVGL